MPPRTIDNGILAARIGLALVTLGLQSNTMVRAQSTPVSSLPGPVTCASQLPIVARTSRLPEPLIAAVLSVESGGRSHAVSRAGAMGCMQLMPDTWTELRARLRLGSDPFDVRDNMLAGTAYLRELYDRYGWQGALAAYNAGPGRYELYRSAGIRLPPETRAYLSRLGILGPDSGDDALPTIAAKHADWTQAPLFVVNADARSASPNPSITRRETAAELHPIAGDDVARTKPGMLIVSRTEASEVLSSSIFVETAR